MPCALVLLLLSAASLLSLGAAHGRLSGSNHRLHHTHRVDEHREHRALDEVGAVGSERVRKVSLMASPEVQLVQCSTRPQTAIGYRRRR